MCIRKLILCKLSRVAESINRAYLLQFSDTDQIALDLSKTSLASIERDYFASGLFRSLRSIDLSRNGIGELTSDCFKGLEHLSELNMSNNVLEFLTADTFQHLLALEHLNLSANSIETIEPGAFRRLDKLQRLDLSSNRIQAIDSHTFQGLASHLNLLDLSNNVNLTMAHESAAPFRHMVDLTELRVCVNTTMCAEASFSGLSSLRRLQLHLDHSFDPSGGQLAAIFEDMTNLQALRLSSFKLIDVLDEAAAKGEPTIDRLFNLVTSLEIKLSSSAGSRKLATDSCCLRRFRKLRELRIVGWCRNYRDQPTDISAHLLANLSQLRSITIESVYQEGGHLAPALFDSTAGQQQLVEQLSLRSMALKSIPHLHLHAHLRELDLSSNKLTVLCEDQLADLTSLESLNLANNRLSEIQPGALRGLARLKELNMSKNNLSELDECMFADVPRLEKLNMSHNSLSLFPLRIFAPLTRLVDLDISFCKARVSILHGALFVAQRRCLRRLNMKMPRAECVLDASLFANMSCLETLVYSHNQTAATSSDLFVPLAATLTELEFSYGHKAGRDGALAMLKCLVNLRKLHLIGECMQSPDVSTLSCMRKLEHLHLTDPSPVSAKCVLYVDESKERNVIASMPSLRHLRVTNVGLQLIGNADDSSPVSTLEYSHPFLNFVVDFFVADSNYTCNKTEIAI